MNARKLKLAATLVVAGSLVACEGAEVAGGANGDVGPVDPASLTGTPLAAPGTDTHLEGLVAQAADDLARRTGLPTDAIELVESRPVTWRNGSIGCPRPGYMYTQALVPGALIILRAGEKAFRYHSGRTGPPFLCETPAENEPLPESPPEGLP
jgi:hypothetical protein